MLLSELMALKSPNVNFEGSSVADDMVLAVNLSDPAASHPDDYFLAQKFISEHTGTLDAKTADNNYIRAGEVSIKTGTKRTITVSGDRYFQDAFQDAILAHELKYGRGQDVIKEYVFFNIRTGLGESGIVSIAVGDDVSGSAGDNLSFTASLTTVAEPEEYKYVSQTP